ncbi:MAG: DNA mismatch repair endonuclease MutL [Chloroflexota bacterium]|nr:DNA mismatch repair endonuclease MutL [Chloroflexota bacterium]
MAIRILSPELVSKIAAGEVVERPASVVKELVENALDAGARAVRVEVRQGGRDLLRITDNGVGMTPDDVRLAVEPHATSKVATLADLQNITTLGFRGEALASIAAVSRFTLLSRPLGSHEGFEIQMDGGRPVTERARGCPEGTAVTVRDLFQHVPARLKFLRSVATETAFITRVIQAYALGRPDVRFELVVDGRNALRTTGDGDLRATIGQVFGHETGSSALALPDSDRSVETPATITGYVAHPSHDRADRTQILFFVNNRWVQHRSMLYALEEAYHSLLMVGRHPTAVVSLVVPPHLVDVNVHPTKQEVRFVHDRDVTRMLGATVRAALLGNATAAAVPLVSLPSVFSGQTRDFTRHASSFPSADQHVVSDAPASWNTPMLTAPSTGGTDDALRGTSAQPSSVALPDAARLRVLGQVVNTYIIAEDATGMYLIDQHAAHERVMLERMRERLREGASDTQWLLAPLSCVFPAMVQQVLETHADDLVRLGYLIEPFGDGTWLLRGVPAAIRGQHAADPVAALEAALAELGAGKSGDEAFERLAALLACHNAIRAGQPLSDPEMRALIRQLEGVETPGHCAHGRPTMLHISQRDLEREFSRR